MTNDRCNADRTPDEDIEDVRSAADARAEMVATGQEPIPWEVVKAELGL